jgi:hypothetical protein
MTPEFKKRVLSLKISEGISKAIGKMCNLERSTSARYLQQFFIRQRSRAFSTQYSIIYIVCHVMSLSAAIHRKTGSVKRADAGPSR